MRLKIHRDDGTVAQYRAYPEAAVKLLFPAGEAVLEPDATPEKWKFPAPQILKRIQTVRVSDTKRRFVVMGVSFGDQLFIFDGLFSSENSIVMSQLIRASASAPRDEAGALDLAMVYLALSYYRLEDPDRFIAYKGSDSREKESPRNKGNVSDTIGVPHSPQILRKGTTYNVDFYAFEARAVRPSKVKHWQINVGAYGLDERLSAHNEGFQEPYSAATGEVGQTQKKVRFSPTMMANGVTDDGAETDLQLWDSSDGSGLQRTHYYYKSSEQAEKRMQDFMQNAVAIIETRPWLDSQGKNVGTQALMIRVNDSEKTLMASEISKDESSVLEISCESLTNLMAALSHEIPGWKQ
jgi:hypothetical protein